MFPKVGPKPKIFGAHRHRAGGQQTVPVRIPQVFVASRGKGRPAGPAPVVHASRFAVHGRPIAQDVRVVRKSQAHQQRNGHQRTGKSSVPVFARLSLGAGSGWKISMRVNYKRFLLTAMFNFRMVLLYHRSARNRVECKQFDNLLLFFFYCFSSEC